MINPHTLFLALLMILLVSACGKKDPPSPTSSPIPEPSQVGLATASAASLPSDLPPCPGIVSLESSSGDAQAGSAIYLSSQAVDALLDSYTPDLLADGWVMDSSVQQGSEHHLFFRQGDRFLRFQIAPSTDSAGRSRLQLAWGQAAGTQDLLEAFEPEPEEIDPSDMNQGSAEW